VASAALLVHGCAVTAVDLPRPPGPEPVAVRPGRPGFVIAAPRDAGDVQADQIAVEVARRTGFGLVVASASARGAREAYERRVREAAQGPLRFYAEIHGGGPEPCAGQLAIGTAGVDSERALRLRALAELIRDAHLRGSPEVQRLDVSVEPADRSVGLPREPSQALHIELPRCGRRDFRETYAAVLADFLAQAVLLPGGR
jgi:hypothetical protein